MWCQRLLALQNDSPMFERVGASFAIRSGEESIMDADEEYAEPTMVFFGGPPGIGKRRALRLLVHDSRYTVSRINYQTLKVAYLGDDKMVLRHLLTRRVGNMIYEHTGLCFEYVHRMVSSEIERRDGDCLPKSTSDVYAFYETCRETQRREMQRYSQWREQQMLIALDLRGCYFKRMLPKRLPAAYLYIIAYLAAIAEHQFYPRTYMLAIVDEKDEDPMAERLGLYELVKSLVSRTCQMAFCHDYVAVIDYLCVMHRPLRVN